MKKDIMSYLNRKMKIGDHQNMSFNKQVENPASLKPKVNIDITNP